MWVIPNSLSNRAGSCSSSLMSLSLPPFEACVHFTRCWISPNVARLVSLFQEVTANTHTYTHTCTHAISNLSLLNASSVQPALLWKTIQKGIDYKGGLTPHSHWKSSKNKRPAWPCGSNNLIILLKWRRMHFSRRDHRAGVAFGWAGFLAGSPPLWCVLINMTLIVPWCYFEAWKWAFFK